MTKNGFKDKFGTWALITGASEGIGNDFVYELASRGFSLVLVARRNELLEKLQNEIINKFKVEVIIKSLDLSEMKNTIQLAKETENIDIGLIILAAGFGSGGEFSKMKLETEIQMIELNCSSAVSLTHTFINRFQKKNKGGIVLFGSLVGFQGVSWSSVYAATKAFIQSFVEGIRGELKKSNIEIISAAPGPIQSGFGNRANMKMGMSQSTKGIAKETLDALGSSTTVRPGFLSKFLGYSLLTLPRQMRTIILNKIMKDMVFKKSSK